jgi:hypothetical protein
LEVGQRWLTVCQNWSISGRKLVETDEIWLKLAQNKKRMFESLSKMIEGRSRMFENT